MTTVHRPEAGGSLVIGGLARAGGAGAFPVEDPATGAVIAHVADGDTTDATAAVDAAHGALECWRGTPARARSEILTRAHQLMIRDRDRLTELVMAENGKSRADALSEITYAAEFFRWYAEEAVRAEGAYGPAPAGGARTLVTHRAVGVAALITPWNFPAAMATRKVAPALAAGCTVVLKPAAETPLTALAIAELLTEAGVPKGVVNVLPTTDASAVVSTWLNDPRVRKVSFTGSTGVGRVLLRQAAERIVNSSMELGGNAPFIVTADADLDDAVHGAMIAKFRNGGQACTAANRFYVHSDIADEFTARFGAEVEALTVGAASHGAQIGPLISARAQAGVEALVEDAVRAGARVSHRADVAQSAGYFYPPTVLSDVRFDNPIVASEIFGPVAPIVEWTDETAVLGWANASEMGLAAYVYARDMQHAIRIAESLEAGMVGINRGVVSDPSAPFGGVKQSGLGREGGRYGLEEFQETQYFSLDWPA
ncbi:NAD-dependent succinate-semialdehyde dehydrogenase [Mycolicibacterium sp.]|uniref:NAD-dependent succinate-semialdehyde dehydrogenase n=1 Tax=Mycolicibacterium sp. TaxID=2320850 RepID=UPI001A276123|nr:NAD-dependent succinate-semialdehyde dehydrogenase [Mycolicibacterium sp.]MBJ7341275.1 NAD-dependent succinate-semialdehyde dehydrogenase [Mycolicibacterium sp.]